MITIHVASTYRHCLEYFKVYSFDKRFFLLLFSPLSVSCIWQYSFELQKCLITIHMSVDAWLGVVKDHVHTKCTKLLHVIVEHQMQYFMQSYVKIIIYMSLTKWHTRRGLVNFSLHWPENVFCGYHKNDGLVNTPPLPWVSS